MELLLLGLVIGTALFVTYSLRSLFRSKVTFPVPRARLPGLSIRKGWAFHTTFIFILVIVTLAVIAILGVRRWEFLDSRISETHLPIAAFYFAIMVAGMGAEYMFGLKRWRKFQIEEFVRPFWVSLIVFSVPWSVIDKETVSFASIIACYQNGFFWKIVLKAREKEAE